MRARTETRIAAIRQEIDHLKALVKVRMHDSGAVSSITHQLRALNSELNELEQTLRAGAR
jgi:hypothetical protein